MRINAIETIRVEAYPNITFVEIHTDEGLSGLGETFRTPKAVVAQIHETAAPYLLGKSPLTIDAHSNVLLNPYLGFASSSVETRAASAIDIALWDLRGKALNCPCMTCWVASRAKRSVSTTPVPVTPTTREEPADDW